jgi:hypothetical protein
MQHWVWLLLIWLVGWLLMLSNGLQKKREHGASVELWCDTVHSY